MNDTDTFWGFGITMLLFDLFAVGVLIGLIINQTPLCHL